MLDRTHPGSFLSYGLATFENPPSLTGKSKELRPKSAAETYARSVAEAFAPMFGVTGPALEQACAVVAACDAFCRAVDYVTDAPRSEIGVLHDGALSLIHGVRIASALGTEPARFFERLEAYMHQASAAERALWRHKGRQLAFTSEDLANLGRKNAIMKAAPAALAAVSGRWALLPIAEQALDDLCIGVQLVDDLLDWEEDLLSESFTLPLLQAVGRTESCAPRDVERAIFEGGVADELLGLVERRLASASAVFRNQGCGEPAELVDVAADSVRKARVWLRAAPRTAEGLRGVLHPIVCYTP